MLFAKKIVEFIFLVTIILSLSFIMHKQRSSSMVYVHTGQRTSELEIQNLRKQKNSSSVISFVWNNLKNFFTLNWGKNTFGNPLRKSVIHALFITLKISLIASFLSLFIGVVIGVTSENNKKLYPYIRKTMEFMLSIPIFIIALFLLWLFSGVLKILPPGGTDSVLWMVLPVSAFSAKSIVRIALFTMDFTDEQKKKAYYLTHRAYGIQKKRLDYIFQLKNIALPILALWLVDFSGFISGSAIIESIYSIPGLGYLILKSVYTYDIQSLTICMLLVSIMIFLISSLQEIMNKSFMKYEQ